MALAQVFAPGRVLSIGVTIHRPAYEVFDVAPAKVSPLLQYLLALPTTLSFWQPLSPYGFFAWPEGHVRWLDLGLFRDAKKSDYALIQVDVHPDFPAWAWLLPFHDLVATTDTAGAHLGQHPRGAWRMQKQRLEQALVLARS